MSASQAPRSEPAAAGRRALLAGLLVVAAVAAGAVLLVLRGGSTPPADTPERWHWGRVAVMPFRPEPGTKAEPWLGELLTRAAERGALEQRNVSAELLAAVELSRAREDEPPDLALPLAAARVGRLTGTPWVVTGSFNLHPQDAQVLATVSVVRARDGKQVVGFTRVGYLRDPEALGQAVAEAMVSPLATLFQNEEPLEMGRALATDPEARDAFIEAQQLFTSETPLPPALLARAGALLDIALQREPDLLPARRLELQMRLARHAYTRNPTDLDAAIAAAEWLRDATGSVDAWLQLCRLHRMSDDLPAALAACQTARKKAPERTPYLALAELLFEFGRDEEAGRLLEEALERQPYVGWLFLAAARHSIVRGLNAQAEQMAREAVTLQDAEVATQGDSRARAEGWPALRGAHGLLARVLLHRGHNQEAAAEARKEIEQLRAAPAPDSPESLLEAGLVLRLAGEQLGDEAAVAQGREAEGYARQSLLGEKAGPAEFLRAAWTYGADDAAEALALCRKGLAIEPEHPALNRLAAIVAARAGDKEAEAFTERAVKARARKCPDCARAYRGYIQRAIENW